MTLDYRLAIPSSLRSSLRALHPHQKKRQQNAVVFYFKGLEVAPQPKMLCILPPLVGCTLEQVLAVSESLRRRKPTSFIARPCLAPLSVAFSSFVKTEFCRISLKGTPLAISRIFTKGSSIRRFLKGPEVAPQPKMLRILFYFYPLEKKFTETCFGESEKTNR